MTDIARELLVYAEFCFIIQQYLLPTLTFNASIVFFLLQDVTGVWDNDITDDIFHTVHVQRSILGVQDVA